MTTPRQSTTKEVWNASSERSSGPTLTGAVEQVGRPLKAPETLKLYYRSHLSIDPTPGAGVDIIAIIAIVLTPSLCDVQQARSGSRQAPLLLLLILSCSLVLEQLLGEVT